MHLSPQTVDPTAALLQVSEQACDADFFFFFFLQHQKLLMHNSTNNPEMHQNSNDSHQRELDVKYCLLKTTHTKKKPTPFMPIPALLSSSICKIFRRAGLQRGVSA